MGICKEKGGKGGAAQGPRLEPKTRAARAPLLWVPGQPDLAQVLGIR